MCRFLIIINFHNIVRYMGNLPTLLQQSIDMGKIFVFIDIALLCIIPAIAQVN